MFQTFNTTVSHQHYNSQALMFPALIQIIMFVLMTKAISGSVTERIADWLGPQMDPPFDCKTDLTADALSLYAFISKFLD